MMKASLGKSGLEQSTSDEWAGLVKDYERQLSCECFNRYVERSKRNNCNPANRMSIGRLFIPPPWVGWSSCSISAINLDDKTAENTEINKIVKPSLEGGDKKESPGATKRHITMAHDA